VYHGEEMSTPPSGDKPYTVYRAGDPGGGPAGRPPSRDRGRRRKRRGGGLLALLIVLGIVAAAAAGVAAAGWRPFGGGSSARQDPAAATKPGVTASAVARTSPSPGGPAAVSSSPSASPAPTAAPAFSVTAGGDVIGGFGVSGVVASMGSSLFKEIAPTFEKSDFGFVNLESPLTYGGDPQGWKDVVIKGNPALAPAMAASGINVVTMANNHAGDMGDSGLLDSLRYCAKNGITVVGAGKDLRKAQSGAVLTTKDGTKVAFLGFTDVLPAGYPATATSPGTSPGRADLGAVLKAIKAAKRKADYVIVGWHWNLEYKRAPSSLESSEGKAAIDAGADIVFAHHPHLLDGVQAYHGGLICYSLGNLVFSGFSGETAETVLVRAKVSGHGIDAQLVPVVGGGSGVPHLASSAQAASILARVKSFSAALDTNLKIAAGRGYVHVRR
jgi:poly-gamma-glutamate capsule biosynthesis protein CapA/YwtB (metallophosphatase superfamily)